MPMLPDTADAKQARSDGPIAIRRAAAADVGTVGRLLVELAVCLGEPKGYRADVAALLRHGFGERAVYRALLAERGADAVGLCVYFPEFSTWQCRPGVYVQDLYVAPGLRGTGVGHRLLAAAARDGREAWDAGYLRLAVHVLNRDARSFYHALGFTADTDNLVMKLQGADFERVLDPENPTPATPS